MLIVVVDIDGTLACDRARRILAGPQPKPWDQVAGPAWLERLQPDGALAKDPAVLPVAEVARLLSRRSDRLRLVVLTGREERYREETEAWLREQGLGSHRLVMRPRGHQGTAAEFKLPAMQRLVEEIDPFAQVLVFDDDPDGDCSPGYLKLGYIHLKVLR